MNNRNKVMSRYLLLLFDTTILPFVIMYLSLVAYAGVFKVRQDVSLYLCYCACLGAFSFLSLVSKLASKQTIAGWFWQGF